MDQNKHKGGHGNPYPRKDEAIALLRENPNPRWVAQQLGDISHVSVWKMAKKAVGIDLGTSYRRRASTPENCAAIVSLVSSGMTFRQAANAIGVSPATVCTVVNEAGLDLGDRSKRKNTKINSEKPKDSFTPS